MGTLLHNDPIQKQTLNLHNQTIHKKHPNKLRAHVRSSKTPSLNFDNKSVKNFILYLYMLNLKFFNYRFIESPLFILFTRKFTVLYKKYLNEAIMGGPHSFILIFFNLYVVFNIIFVNLIFFCRIRFGPR